MTAPRRLQLRRGNTAAISTYVGAAGELVVNTTTNTLYLHDGSTVGGFATTSNITAINNQISSVNANITLANTGMRGYVDATIAANIANIAVAATYSNVNVKAYTESMGYQNYGNVNVAAYVTTANSAIIGYIDLANTIQSAQVGAANLAITAANLGMRGYVDSVASQSIYGNGNVKSYLTIGFDGNILPSANVTYSLGSPTQQWRDLFVSNNTIYIGGVPLSINASGSLTVAGNVIAGTNLVTYGSNVSASAVTLSGPTGAVGNVHVLDPGNGFTMFGFFAGSGGSGTGFSIVAQNSTIFNPVQFNIRGTGYRVGDVITIVNTNTGPGYSDATVVVTELLGIASPGIYLGNTAYRFGADGNIRLPAGGGILDSTGVSVLGTGGTNYSNVNVAAYTTTQGYTNYSNVNVAAYVTTANSAVIGYVDNKVSTANVGVIGYVDLANTIQSAQITAANLGMRGYVDNQITTITGGAPAILDTLGELANALGADANLSVTITSQIANVNANITTANLGMRGYVDSQTFYSNARVATYLQYGNPSNISVAGNVTATYFVGNGALLTGIAASSNYSNVQVATYLPTYTGNIANVRLGVSGVLTFADGTTQTTAATGGGSSYSNVNVAAYLSTATINTTGNITAGNLFTSGALYVANITTTGASGNISGANYITANYFVGNGALLTGLSSSYSNVQVATYLPTYTGVVTASNVAVAGNVTAQYLFGNGSQLTGIIAGSSYSNIQVATYLPTYSGDIGANISKAGYTWTFGTDGTLTLPASSGQIGRSGYPNGIDLYNNNGGTGYVRMNYADQSVIWGDAGGAHIQSAGTYTWDFDTTGNLKLPSGGYILNSDNSIYGGGSSYSNVQVATYLPTYSGNIANIRLGVAGVLTFADGTTQITAGGGSYSNVQVATYLPTYAGTVSASLVNTSGNILSSGLSVFGNTRIGLAGAASGQFHTVVGNITQTSSGGAVYFNTTGNVLAAAVVAGAVTSTGTVAVNAATGITTNQGTFLLANATATTINIGGAATTINLGTTASATGNVFVGGQIGSNAYNLTLRANGRYNVATSINSNGGFNSPPYANQLVIGGTGTGMTANYSATGGYIDSLTIYNSGTGYRNGDVISVPGGVAGNSFVLQNYSPSRVGAFTGTALYTFGIDGNLIVPGNVSATTFVGSGALLTSLPGYAYSNVNVASYLSTATINTTGNITAQNLIGNISITGNVTGTSANVTLQAGSYSSTFDNQGNVRLPTAYVTGNVTANYFVGNGALLTGIVAGSNYSNVQVATYLPTYQGNIVAANVWTTGNATGSGALTVGPAGYTALPTTIAQFTGNANTYTQLNLQNISTGSDATAEYVATANNGTDTTFFVDLGIANSNYDVNSPNNSLGTTIFPNDSYLYAQGNLATTTGGNLVIGTSTANKTVKIFAGGINSANIVATVSNTGLVVTGNISASGNITAQYFIGNGALLTGIVASSSYSNVQVATYLPAYGGAIQSSNVQTTSANIQATTAATNPATGALRVMGGVGVAGTVFAGQLNTTGNLVASVVNAGTINSAGNVLAQNIIGTIATASQTNITAVGTLATLSVTGNATVGNLIGTEANTRIIANVYTTTFDIYGNVSFPGNVIAPTFVGSGSLLSGVATKTTGSWTVTAGTNTYSFTIPDQGAYQLWVIGNIPNGIISYNATATITNSNVPVVGAQYAWVYNGGGSPIDFTSIPNQFTGTGNTIVRSTGGPSATTNRFDFGISNTSGGNVTVSYGYVKIS